MDHRSQSFCSKLSFGNSSNFVLKQILENIPSQDIHEAVRKIYLKYQKIANDFVQAFNFMIIAEEDPQILTIYLKKGIYSWAQASKSEEKEKVDMPLWSVTYQGRTFLGAHEYGENDDGKYSLTINEYVVKDQTWKRKILKFFTNEELNACTIKNKIILTGKIDRDANQIGFDKTNDGDAELSRMIYTIALPDDVVEGYSITNILNKYVILAGGQDENFDWLPTVYEGVLNNSH